MTILSVLLYKKRNRFLSFLSARPQLGAVKDFTSCSGQEESPLPQTFTSYGSVACPPGLDEDRLPSISHLPTDASSSEAGFSGQQELVSHPTSARSRSFHRCRFVATVLSRIHFVASYFVAGTLSRLPFRRGEDI